MASKRSSIAVPKSAFAGLKLERLEGLVNDDVAFLEYFLSLDLNEVTQAKRNRELIVQSNKELARSTYSKKSEFEEKKAKVVDLSMIASELKQAYNEKYEKLKSLTGKTDQKMVLRRLRDLSREVENESESLASEFLSGESDLRPEEFISKFCKMRTTYWLRNLKAGEMDKLMKQQPPYPSAPTSVTPYPPASLSGSVMPQPFPSGFLVQSTRPSHPPQPTQSFPPSYVHGSQPGASPTQSLPPPSYAQASRMPMPQPPSHTPHTQGYPPPTSSLYGRNPQQYGVPPPAISRPPHPVQPYPYGNRPSYSQWT